MQEDGKIATLEELTATGRLLERQASEARQLADRLRTREKWAYERMMTEEPYVRRAEMAYDLSKRLKFAGDVLLLAAGAGVLAKAAWTVARHVLVSTGRVALSSGGSFVAAGQLAEQALIRQGIRQAAPQVGTVFQMAVDEAATNMVHVLAQFIRSPSFWRETFAVLLRQPKFMREALLEVGGAAIGFTASALDFSRASLDEEWRAVLAGFLVAGFTADVTRRTISGVADSFEREWTAAERELEEFRKKGMDTLEFRRATYQLFRIKHDVFNKLYCQSAEVQVQLQRAALAAQQARRQLELLVPGK
ncbi:MAG TPA: hypothetical protein VGA56_09325 [Opitutaceae bacterium]